MATMEKLSMTVFYALVWFCDQHISKEEMIFYSKKKELVIIPDFSKIIDEDLNTMDLISIIDPCLVDIRSIDSITIRGVTNGANIITAEFLIDDIIIINKEPKPNRCKITSKK